MSLRFRFALFRCGYRFRGSRPRRLFRHIPFQNDGETLGAFLYLLGHLVTFGNDREESLQTFFEETKLHVLVTAPEKEIDFHAVSLAEPRRRL